MAHNAIKGIINLRNACYYLACFENTRHLGIWHNNVLCGCETHCCTLIDGCKLCVSECEMSRA